MRIVWGSCRVARPHTGSYILDVDEHPEGVGVDALHALALRMRDQPQEQWPRLLLLLGDQVYADEASPETVAKLRARRDTSRAPGEEVLDVDEYTMLYEESWCDPSIRWLMSTVGSAMMFDDHDVHDDWNTSESWIRDMRATTLVASADRLGAADLLGLPAPRQPVARRARRQPPVPERDRRG